MPDPRKPTPIEIERGWDEKDIQVRSLFGIDALSARETGTALDILHYYWSSLQLDTNGLPTIADFRFEEIIPDFESRDIGWIDTTAETPGEFVILHHPASPVSGWGIELSGKTLADYPNAMREVAGLGVSPLQEVESAPLP